MGRVFLRGNLRKYNTTNSTIRYPPCVPCLFVVASCWLLIHFAWIDFSNRLQITPNLPFSPVSLTALQFKVVSNFVRGLAFTCFMQGPDPSIKYPSLLFSPNHDNQNNRPNNTVIMKIFAVISHRHCDATLSLQIWQPIPIPIFPVPLLHYST